jgi:hypothetical protein
MRRYRGAILKATIITTLKMGNRKEKQKEQGFINAIASVTHSLQLEGES